MLKIIGKRAENLAVHVLGGRGELEVFVWRRGAINVSDRSRRKDLDADWVGGPRGYMFGLASDECRSDITRVG